MGPVKSNEPQTPKYTDAEKEAENREILTWVSGNHNGEIDDDDGDE